MEYTKITDYCLRKPGVLERNDAGSTVFTVDRKMFAVLNIQRSKGLLSLKCDRFMASTLLQQYPSVKLAYHMDEPDWIIVTLDGAIAESEILWMIDHSYDLAMR